MEDRLGRSAITAYGPTLNFWTQLAQWALKKGRFIEP